MAQSYLQPASERDIQRMWPAVNSTHLFEESGDFRRMWEVAPWRVRVSAAGDAAILRPWRADHDVLAVTALWCPESHVPRAIGDLAAVARNQGFGHLLSPLVKQDSAKLYTRAGMVEHESIVTLRMDSRGADGMRGAFPESVTLRSATPDDIPAMHALDEVSFDEFWRYGTQELSDYFVSDRAAVASGPEGLIGYTLCTAKSGIGTLGRLAIHPSARRTGVGTALLRDAIGYMARQGAEMVSLCTQEDNHASRALYAGIGMRELPDRLLLLIMET
jgi:ribosomal protein S18 acetylase RimI-like enzyme